MWKEVHEEHMKHDAEYEQLSEDIGEVADLVYHAVDIWKTDASKQVNLLEKRMEKRIDELNIDFLEMLRAYKLKRLVGEKTHSGVAGKPALGEVKKWKKGTIGRVKWFRVWRRGARGRQYL